MPTEHQSFVEEQYQKFMEERRQKKEAERKKNQPPPPPPGISPMELGMKRDPLISTVPITRQVNNDSMVDNSFL